LNVGQNESVFQVPQLNRMVRAQVEDALPLFERLAENENTSSAKYDLIQAQLLLGALLAGAGELESAGEYFAIARDSAGQLPLDGDGRMRLDSLIDSQIKLGAVLGSQQKHAEAERILKNTQSLVERLVSHQPENAGSIERQSWLLHNLANAQVGQKDYESAALKMWTTGSSNGAIYSAKFSRFGSIHRF